MPFYQRHRLKFNRRGVNDDAMPNTDSLKLTRVFTLMAGLLILKVTADVLVSYHGYFPPDFESDFLRGRERYFSGFYQWAFYTHIATGPVSLILGLILVSQQFRLRLPKWHRYLGRIQAVCVLFLITPSGMWMAFYASTGVIAAVGFATLSAATGVCVAIGWRSAVKRRFTEHNRWMFRCFLLLCSAVVIRMIGGLATVLGVEAEWIYPLAAWISWLVPLIAFEISRIASRQSRESLAQSVQVSHGS